jgi:hypothetical protein
LGVIAWRRKQIRDEEAQRSQAQTQGQGVDGLGMKKDVEMGMGNQMGNLGQNGQGNQNFNANGNNRDSGWAVAH